ncbi:hypothetical protein Agub_g1074, partial [Astrephomene gubernaculifera]
EPTPELRVSARASTVQTNRGRVDHLFKADVSRSTAGEPCRGSDSRELNRSSKAPELFCSSQTLSLKNAKRPMGSKCDPDRSSTASEVEGSGTSWASEQGTWLQLVTITMSRFYRKQWGMSIRRGDSMSAGRDIPPRGQDAGGGLPSERVDLQEEPLHVQISGFLEGQDVVGMAQQLAARRPTAPAGGRVSNCTALRSIYTGAVDLHTTGLDTLPGRAAFLIGLFGALASDHLWCILAPGNRPSGRWLPQEGPAAAAAP